MWECVDSLLLSPGAAIARVNTRGRQVTVVLPQARRAHITGQGGIADSGDLPNNGETEGPGFGLGVHASSPLAPSHPLPIGCRHTLYSNTNILGLEFLNQGPLTGKALRGQALIRWVKCTVGRKAGPGRPACSENPLTSHLALKGLLQLCWLSSAHPQFSLTCRDYSTF